VSIPYFPMYPADFEAKTSHLTLEEDGAYNRLLRLMWMTPGCSLPDAPAWLIRRMRIDAATFERVVAPLLSEFFERKSGRLHNPRLRAEFEKADETYRKRSSAGKRGGRPKAVENKEKEQKAGLSNEKAGPKQPEPEPEPDIKIERERDAGAEIVDFPDPQSVPKNRTAEAEGRPVPHDKAEHKPAPQQCHCGRRACAGVNCQGILDDCGRREDLPADDLFSQVLHAAGHTGGRIPTAWMPPAASVHVARWSADLGLTPAQVLDVVREAKRHAGGAVHSPRFFDFHMQAYARALAAPLMQPAQGAGPYRSPGTSPLQGGGRSNYEYLLSLMQDEPGKDGANDARTAQ